MFILSIVQCSVLLGCSSAREVGQVAVFVDNSGRLHYGGAVFDVDVSGAPLRQGSFEEESARHRERHEDGDGTLELTEGADVRGCAAVVEYGAAQESIELPGGLVAPVTWT